MSPPGVAVEWGYGSLPSVLWWVHINPLFLLSPLLLPSSAVLFFLVPPLVSVPGKCLANEARPELVLEGWSASKSSPLTFFGLLEQQFKFICQNCIKTIFTRLDHPTLLC